MRMETAKRLIATAAVTAGALAGPMAAGAAAQDICPVDPATGECDWEYVPDSTFFPDSTFMPGVDHFPDSTFDANPNSGRISFGGNERMPSCTDDDAFITDSENMIRLRPKIEDHKVCIL